MHRASVCLPPPLSQVRPGVKLSLTLRRQFSHKRSHAFTVHTVYACAVKFRVALYASATDQAGHPRAGVAIGNVLRLHTRNEFEPHGCSSIALNVQYVLKSRRAIVQHRTGLLLARPWRQVTPRCVSSMQSHTGLAERMGAAAHSRARVTRPERLSAISEPAHHVHGACTHDVP